MRENKKVGLVAVLNHNYGSQLQTYAMHRTLTDMGVDNEIIKYRQKTIKQLKRAKNLSFLAMKGKFVIRNISCRIKYPQISRGLAARAEAFESFKKKNCRYSPLITDPELLTRYACNYRAVILGSDQVWHPANLEMDYFTLGFVPEGIPKIAYAPSFGVSEIPEKQIERTRQYLSGVDEISVREITGAQIIKNLTGREVPVVCDPTALLTREQWDTVRSDRAYTDERYIFCYFLGTNRAHREYAEKLRSMTGYKIVALQHLDELVKSDIDFGDIKPFDVTPGDLVNLIANAELVITDSFHGTMFSIYYHKRFFTFSRFSDTGKNSTNSRIATILGRLGLQARYTDPSEDPGLRLNMDIDWDSVDGRLAAFRAESLEYLSNAVGKYRLAEESSDLKTIECRKKEDCTGCTACAHACPQKCIEMKPDAEGFLYPSVDSGKCVGCGMCRKICPVDSKAERRTGTAYAARVVDRDVRMNSSSGGVFSALAQYVLDKGGVVAGACFDRDMKLSHVLIDKPEELYRLRASKYVQSDLKAVFPQIAEALENGRYVLFCGTPCQSSGLKHYLKKDYDRLIVADVLCYGVPSPGVFEKFVKYMEEKHRSKMTEFYFRDKKYGYASPNVKAVFANGDTEEMTSDVKSFTKTFFAGVTTRPACFDCKFKSAEKETDITLGDFWTAGEVFPYMDDDTGVTLVFAHTKKAIDVLNGLDCLQLEEISIDDATAYAGPMLLNSAKPSVQRGWFFRDIDAPGYRACVDRYVPDLAKNRIANVVKPILLKTGLTKSGILKLVKKKKIQKESK